MITVSVPEDIRKQRLAKRGLSEAEMDRRIAAQASDSEREAISDFVIHNAGGIEDLTSTVEKIWAKLQILNKGK